MDKKKLEKFQDELSKIQKKYGLQLYAANVVVGGEHGEVIPVVKIRTQEPDMVDVEETK